MHRNVIATEMIDEAAAIRAVYPRNTMKMLARLLGMPLDTARHSLYRRFSSARRRELAVALLAEMDAQEVERGAVRRRLAEWAADQ
jgi:hypothetical protein